ncbi:hypothetical protein PMSD_04985 [Paenibacillus macquariensis subsp. defensor]|nr:hypothetical protein PMSD_04985 [Paenibacillus macquariensis subsp. defensor]
MDVISEVQPFLIKILREVNIYPTDDQIRVLNRGKPHVCKMVAGKMYIYTYQYQDEYLKIGKAGIKSKARFYSHHYNPESSKSNLAKSIVSDPAMSKYLLTSSSVGDWIKNNVTRIDLEIDVALGVFGLNLIESILHCLYQPKYEGYKTQRTL